MGQTNSASCSGMRYLSCGSLDSQLEWANHHHLGWKNSPRKYRPRPLRSVNGPEHQTVRETLEASGTHRRSVIRLPEVGQKKSGAVAPLLLLVSKGGLEPPRPCGRRPLKPVRLPISPLRRGCQDTEIALIIGRANSAGKQVRQL